MPAVLTHYFLAESVLKNQIKIRSNINWDKDAFFWGAQGPDFFYLSRIFPWQKGKNIRKYGYLFHNEKPSLILDALKNYYNIHSSDLVLSYIAGFITHYALDSTAHPFINYGAKELHKINKNIPENIYHHDIEANLDIIVLRNKTEKLPTEIRIERLISKNDVAINSISKLYKDIIQNLFNDKINEIKIREAMLDYYKALKLMNDRTTIKKQLLKRVERLVGKGPILSSHIRSMTEETSYDYSNSLNLEWTNEQTNLKSNKDFFEIMEDAEHLSYSIIDDLINNVDFSSTDKYLYF